MNATADNLLVSLDLAESRGEVARLSAEQAETFARAKVRLMEGDSTVALALASLFDQTVSMPVYRWTDASKRVTTLAKKAAKRGLPVPSIEEVSRETREDGSEWLVARMLGAAPVLNGWRCLATVVPWTDASSTETGIVCTASGVDELPEWREHPSRCQHCNTNRKRSLTFIVAHEDGRVVQVGRTCLNEYIGTDALAAWFVWSELRELETDVGGWGFDSIAHAQWLADNAAAATRRKKTPAKRPLLVDFLAACAASIRVHGYQRSNWHTGTLGTGEGVYRAMSTAEHEAVIDVDHEVATRAVARVTELASRDPASVGAWERQSFDVACSFVARKFGDVKLALANTLASIVLAEIERHPVAVNEYLPGASVGDVVTLTLVPERDLSWAWQTRDDAGRCVLVRDVRGHAWKVGTPIRVSATFHELTSYRGRKQTIVRNPKPAE